MATHDPGESSTLTLLEAVEALSSLADLELDRDMGVTERHDLILQGTPLIYRTVHWLHRKGADQTVQLVREIFRVILHYIKDIYNREYRVVTKPQTIEGIKTIMILVGEAAKKLDRYTSLFHQTKNKSVTELKEYKQLQEFYQTRIARKMDEGVLGKWLLELTKRAWSGGGRLKFSPERKIDTKHIFIDLDSVRKDSEYELLILRKDDGSRFYNPRLIRNIKLVCDFGDYFPGEKVLEDPLEDAAIWQDRVFHAAAKKMVQFLGDKMDRFYREALQFKDREFFEELNKGLMALMLAANPQNLMRETDIKCCNDYYSDFHHFLRNALRSNDYHRMISNSSKSKDQLSSLVLDVIHTLCIAPLDVLHEMSSFIQGLIREARGLQSTEHEKAAQESHTLWSRLSCDDVALVKLLKQNPSGPLIKMLDLLQEGGIQAFDPLGQHGISYPLYLLDVFKHSAQAIQLPSPTRQEIISRATVVDEFKGFLRSYQKHAKKHLLINLQDRTSWREHARCMALEELQQVEEFKNSLVVVTLSKDTEFYHQLAPYAQTNHADPFMQQFQEHLQDANSGFYFPSKIKEQLFPDFADQAMKKIHQVFFSNRNVLSREHRLDFIEIFYVFLEIKLLEITRADSFSLTCKDGVDVGPLGHALLLAYMKLKQGEAELDALREEMNLIIHTPALINRKRPILQERFNRMMSALKAIESINNSL